MAYIDTSSNVRRSATALAVAALQAGVIYAVVSGLAVTFIDRPEADMPLIANPIPVAPLPVPADPKPELPVAQPRDAFRDPLPRPVDSMPLPTATAQTTEGAGASGGTGDDAIASDPPPPPPPQFAPRSARPRNAPGGWATPADYPISELRAENQGVTRFRLSIGTDGRVLGCEVTGSSGFARLDQTTCDKVSRRARFEPATDGSGNRVPGSYSGSIRWQIPD